MRKVRESRVLKSAGLLCWALACFSLALASSCARREAKGAQPAASAPVVRDQAPAAPKAIPPPDPQALKAFVERFPVLVSSCEIGGKDPPPVALDRDAVEGILGWQGPPWRDPEPAAAVDSGEASQGPIGDADYRPERSFGFYALGRLAQHGRVYLVISRDLTIHDVYRGPRPELSEECRVYALDMEGRTAAMASLASREVPQGSPGDGYDGSKPISIYYEDGVFKMSTEGAGSEKFDAIWTVTILPDGNFEENTEKAPEFGEGK
jgi:hypothetical protein